MLRKGSSIKGHCSKENRMTSGLTRKQKTLMKELDSIFSLIGMDYWEIGKYSEESRTGMLEFQRRQAIIGQIIGYYTFVSQLVDWAVCIYFFRLGKRRVAWGSEKLQKFNDYILESRSLLEKLRIVKSVYEIPKNVVRDVERLNALRNVVAHRCFFEESEDWRREGKAVYKGKNIFTLEGIKMFREDMKRVVDFWASMEVG
jgi:hypothetical protein